MRSPGGALVFVLVSACREPPGPAPTSVAAATVTAPAASRVLPIPARAQAPESPPDGWCGETAIQESLLHFGLWAPQAVINTSGKPSHPDLYSPDIPVALAALGVKHTFYRPSNKGWADYVQWIAKAIDEGEPVLAGVKLLPTQHPEWGLDHFVLVVGYGPEGLLVNTTWGHRLWANDKTTKGISFAKASYAIRLHGLADAGSSRAAQLAVLEEDDKTVKLRASCPDTFPIVARDGKAVGEADLAIPRGRTSRFTCRPMD